jgi:hypothetical protein
MLKSGFVAVDLKLTYQVVNVSVSAHVLLHQPSILEALMFALHVQQDALSVTPSLDGATRQQILLCL